MTTNHIFINSFSDSCVVSSLFVINDIRHSVTKAGKPYLSASLRDASGSIHMICWEYEGDISPVNNGDIVSVTGRVTMYRDQLQLSVEQLDLASPDEIEQEPLNALVSSAPIDVDACAYYVWSTAHRIQDPQLNALCNELLEKHWELFCEIPAGKSVHHAFRNGLLMHTADMLVQAEAVAAHHSATVNRDLLLCGVILHDIGKLYEFQLSPVTGLVIGYTPLGNLLGHSSIGATEVAKAADSLGIDPEISLLVQHMILSHHGDPASGAAKSPMIIEAEILHDLDLMDSRREMYDENLRDVTPGNYSRYIPSLDRTVYRHGLTSYPAPSTGCSGEDTSETNACTSYDPIDEEVLYEAACFDYEYQICAMEADAEQPCRVTATYSKGAPVPGYYDGDTFFPDDPAYIEF